MSAAASAFTPSRDELAQFIRETFRSVWAIELLLHLREHQGRSLSPSAIVSEMRASELVVRQSLECLLVAGLAIIEDNGSTRFAPASERTRAYAEAACEFYRKNPDATRRLIVAASSPGIEAFADAFRLKKE